MVLRCPVQSLNINWTQRNLKASLESSLKEEETGYAMQMEELNRILLHLEADLAQTQKERQHQAQE